MNEIEKKHRKVVCIMSVTLIVCVLASFLLGRYPVPFGELMGILGSRLGLPVEKFWTDQMETAVWNIRLPRVVMSVLVGACLASAGASYQGVFQNPMASPDILGASAGAVIGAYQPPHHVGDHQSHPANHAAYRNCRGGDQCGTNNDSHPHFRGIDTHGPGLVIAHGDDIQLPSHQQQWDQADQNR